MKRLHSFRIWLLSLFTVTSCHRKQQHWMSPNYCCWCSLRHKERLALWFVLSSLRLLVQLWKRAAWLSVYRLTEFRSSMSSVLPKVQKCWPLFSIYWLSWSARIYTYWRAQLTRLLRSSTVVSLGWRDPNRLLWKPLFSFLSSSSRTAEKIPKWFPSFKIRVTYSSLNFWAALVNYILSASIVSSIGRFVPM